MPWAVWCYYKSSVTCTKDGSWHTLGTNLLNVQCQPHADLILTTTHEYRDIYRHRRGRGMVPILSLQTATYGDRPMGQVNI